MWAGGEKCVTDDVDGGHSDNIDDRVVIFRSFEPDKNEVLDNFAVPSPLWRFLLPQGALRRGGWGLQVAIGTHVELDGVITVPYRANGGVPERLLRDMVVSLLQVGR